MTTPDDQGTPPQGSVAIDGNVLAEKMAARAGAAVAAQIRDAASYEAHADALMNLVSSLRDENARLRSQVALLGEQAVGGADTPPDPEDGDATAPSSTVLAEGTGGGRLLGEGPAS